MARLVLWGLNRVARWAPEPMRKALSVPRFLRSPLNEVVMGSRVAFDAGARDATAAAHALQYETDGLDEYFVPIPVKAIGDPEKFRKRLKSEGAMGTEEEKRFDAFLAAYPAHFQKDAWRAYWTPRDRVGMFTTEEQGFYDLVRRARTPDQKAVLVGYSQGGLIANFLAWMDENFVTPDHKVIAGIITVQAPNLGSPLADSDNADNVARGVFEALFGALGYPARPGSAFPQLDTAINALTHGTQSNRQFDIQAVAELVDAAISDSASSNSAPSQVMLTARKWMTGLCPSNFVTAFDDLNTAHLDHPNTVLSLVNLKGHLQRTMHGAVIGTDNSLADLVREQIGGLIFGLGSRFMPGLKQRLTDAQMAYSCVAMDELVSGVTLTAECGRVAKEFRDGVNVLDPKGRLVKLDARAHDFIIPSVSQALGPRWAAREPKPALTPCLLGNLVNNAGTHITGGQEDGDSDVKPVTTLLEEMGRRLAV